MRYRKGQKEKTRRKMVDAVGRGFRKHGYSGIGVDGLSEAASVTSGAFYSHFGSKEAAFNVSLAASLDEVIETVPEYQREHGADWVNAFVEYYLGRPHRKDLECGCAMTTLTPEVVRFGPTVHAVYEERMNMIADLVARGLAGSSLADRRARAWAMLGVLMGGLNIARAMQTSQGADEVANAAKAAAIKAAGRPRAKIPGVP